MARIIGITGLAGAGKDTLAWVLKAELEKAHKQVTLGSFADPIRKISKLIGLEPYDRNLKEKRRSFDLDEFCDSFQAALDTVLGQRLEEHDRAELYAFTVEALEKFTYGSMIGLSPREFMQVLGTEGGQRVRRKLWVELASLLWNALPGFVIVSDVRFGHELQVLDDLLLVIRPGVAAVNSHPSERLAHQLTNGADHGIPWLKQTTVMNDGGLHQLDENARRLADQLNAQLELF